MSDLIDNDNTIHDNSKVSKYKKRKKTEIIVFPYQNKKKNKNNHSPINSKDIEYSGNDYCY